MEKYYLCFSWYSAYGSQWKPQSFVCNVHPFERIHYYNQMDGYETRLSNYQEITKDEHDKYIKLEL